MENEDIKLEEKKVTNDGLKVEDNVAEADHSAPIETEDKLDDSVKEENNKGQLGGPDIFVVRKLQDNEKPLVEDVEEHRKDLFNAYSKSRRTSNILMGVVVAVVIGAMALLLIDQNWSKIVGYSLASVALTGMIVFSLLTKNKFPTKSKQYIHYVTTKIDQYIFNDTEFQDVKVDLNEKYNITEISLDKVYKNIIDIGSRNIVKGLYMGKGFSCGELALYHTKQDGKKTTKAVAFIGKYIDLQNTLHFEGRYILNFKAEKENDLPTDIDDLVQLHNQDGLVVYGLEGSDYKKDIPAKYISELKKIKVASHLLNLNVVLWAGHTGVYLSYDDPVVTLPFEKTFDDAPHYEFKEHLLAVLEAEKIINK